MHAVRSNPNPVHPRRRLVPLMQIIAVLFPVRGIDRVHVNPPHNDDGELCLGWLSDQNRAQKSMRLNA